MKDAIKQNGIDSTIGDMSQKFKENTSNFKCLPSGKYTPVAIDIDTTGRRLIDEIVQLAAFTPNDQFGQYIMPYMDLNPAARQRHQIRVISIGFYRMLKSMKTYKIIKSKSEIAALKDFLDWLEALKTKDVGSQGIILMYYEERKFIPYMILESLKKYNLLDRFLNTVKSFVNILNLAKVKLDGPLQHYTLRKLSKHLKADLSSSKNEQNKALDANPTQISLPEQEASEKKSEKSSLNNKREQFVGSATVRAKLAYEIALHLSSPSTEDSQNATSDFDKVLTALQPYAQPIGCDLNELQAQNANFERQNSFRPIFLNYFITSLYLRVRAVKFRIILAEHSYDLQALNAIWSEKKRDGLVEILEGIHELNAADKTELSDLLDSYFDPAKVIITPVVKPSNRRRNRRIRGSVKNKKGNLVRPIDSEQGASGDKQGSGASNLPDSTTKSPKNRRPKRNSKNKTLPKLQILNTTNTSNPTSIATAVSENTTTSN